jgi:signal transduction histidine kinase
VGGIVLLGALYYGGARLGLPLSFAESNATPIWPPAGIALAGLLVLGRNVWPGIWIPAFVANVIVYTQNHAASNFTICSVSAAIATGNTLEALVGRYLVVRYLAKSENALPAMTERLLLGKLGTFAYAFMAIVSGLASAAVGPWVVCLAGITKWKDFPLIMSTWWAGDATSLLVLTPFLLAFLAPFPKWKVGRWHHLEVAAAFVFHVFVQWSIFDEWFKFEGRRLPLTFATMVPLVWIARRIGLRGTLVALMILCCLAVSYTRIGLGPMSRESEHLSFLLLLGYIWVVTVANLTVACGEEARQYSQRQLYELNEKLEQRVSERTAELRSTNGLLMTEMEERQRLEKEVLKISEREQRQLGQDLHEGVSQQLAGVTFLSKVLADRLRAENHRQSDSAVELSRLLHEALDATRSLARNFYPVEFESGGLQSALQGLAERTHGLFGIECEFRCLGGAPLKRDEDSAIHIYRIVQEALTNVIKHSRAHRVVIECSASGGQETVRIMDNGIGFGSAPNGSGMGLHLMRYRARLIGAVLEVSRQNGNGRGTIVSCSMKAPSRQDSASPPPRISGP